MLYEIGTASVLTKGSSPHPWRENPAQVCGPFTNRRKLLIGELNFHC